MFSKNRITEGSAKPAEAEPQGRAVAAPAQTATVPRPKSPPSTLSSDLTVVGNLRTTGDIQIEGKVEGDIRAHLLTVGETATVKGEIVADDIVVNGRVIGKVRGLKVRLTSTARVEGDIVHKTIAIESGAHFEGSVQRQDDPLGSQGGPARKPVDATADPVRVAQPAQPAKAAAPQTGKA
jgi:cytoskeletal protein CcmA (bactofilin family)